MVLEDDNMALDVYSGGLAIEPLRISIGSLSYGKSVEGLLISCKWWSKFSKLVPSSVVKSPTALFPLLETLT